VDGEAIRKRMLDAYGIRVEPHMSDYVARRLKQAGDALRELPIIGGEARTGMPIRKIINLAQLQQQQQQQQSPTAS
jgi:hypothetical protein